MTHGPDAVPADDAPEVALAPGTLVAHYRVVRPLGRGGMGVVYLARDTQLGRRVALKLVLPRAVGSPEALERFLFEARTTARFNHPHIVAIHGVGSHGELTYVALEYVEGETLRQRLAAGPLAPREVVRLGHAIADALREAHGQGVLHRDLKPENVLIGRDGRLRVLDFGLAKVVEAPTSLPAGAPPELEERLSGAAELWLTEGHRLCGTPAYMAPEQWEQRPLGPATDLWALGVMLYELATGRHPFEASTPLFLAYRVTRGEAPAPMDGAAATLPELEPLVCRCLSRDPALRPSAEAAWIALGGMLGGGPTAGAVERNPFRGLMPFGERHAGQFFGRDSEIEELVERLRTTALMVVAGRSGAGKSSFVHAGVVPRLREQGSWEALSLRPGAEPFRQLATRLMEGGGAASGTTTQRGTQGGSRSLTPPSFPSGVGEDPLEALALALRAEPQRLALELAARVEESGSHLLLVVDQLEELATLVEDASTRQAFLLALALAGEDPDGPIRVVLTARDDFLGQLVDGPVLRKALGQVFVLRPPGPEALAETLRRPVALAGYGWDDPELCGRMVEEVRAETASLPLLQFAAYHLWERRDRARHELTRAAFERMGGVAGALAEHAEGVLTGFDEAGLGVARSLLVRLVTPDRTRRTREVGQLLDGLGDAATSLLERLVEARLCSRRRGEGGPVVELAHEALIVAWKRLGRWLDEGREEHARLQQLEDAAALWDKRGRRTEEVWQGAALDEARRALGLPGTAVPAAVGAFVDAGVGRARRRRALRRGAVAAVLVGLATFMAVLWVERDAAQAARVVAEGAREIAEGARGALEARNATLTLSQARAALETDPTAALAWLGTLDPHRAPWPEMAAVAVEAQARGVASHVLPLHGDEARAVAFSPDGRFLASAGYDWKIGIWEVATGRVTQLAAHHDEVKWVAFSPRGLLASASKDRTVGLWDPAAQAPQRLLSGHRGAVEFVAFDASGDRLASCDDAGEIRVWRLDGSSTALSAGAGGVLRVSFAPKGAQLAAGERSGAVRLWDLAQGTSELLGTAIDEIREVAFSPGGEWLAAAGRDRVVRVWRLAGGDPLALAGHQAEIYGLAFAPGGGWLATSGRDHSVRLWSVADVASPPRVLLGHDDAVRHVTISPDGALVASASDDRTVRVWSASGEPVAVLRGHAARVRHVAFAPDGRALASAASDGTVRWWPLTPAPSRRLLGASGEPRALAASPDGGRVALATADGSVRVWELAGHGSRVLAAHDGEALAVAFGPAGTLATAGRDRRVRLWALDGSEAATREWTTPTRALALHWSPRGRWLAAVTRDPEIALWRFPDGASTPLVGHARRVTAAVACPDGQHLASASVDRTVRLWDVATGQSRPWEGFGDQVQAVDCVGMTPLVAAAGDDGVVRVGDGGTEARQLAGHPRPVYAVRFAPDGARLASGGADGAVRVWTLADGASQVLESLGGTVRSLGWLAGGGRLAVATESGALVIWDPAGGDSVTLHAGTASLPQVVALPDALGAVTAGGDGSAWLWPAHLPEGPEPTARLLRGLTQARFHGDRQALSDFLRR